MRKITAVLSVFIICFSLSSCKAENSTESRPPVVINLPKDDSVNGYRSESTASAAKDNVAADEVATDTNSKHSEDGAATPSSAKYCVNISTGVFHKSDCSAVGKMKEENKKYYNDRNEITAEGYTPCKICTP